MGKWGGKGGAVNTVGTSFGRDGFLAEFVELGGVEIEALAGGGEGRGG